MPSPRYADHRYGGTLRGDPPTGYTNSDTPWAFGSTRVDGLDASEPHSPIVPGQSVTYICRFLPDANEPDGAHIQRAKTVAEYTRRGSEVLAYNSIGLGRGFYREQYDGPSALLRVGPLQADHDGAWVDGDPPPNRDSIHHPRWVVTTGGELSAPGGEQAPATVQLETVTLASVADYPTRDSMIAAAERNGF